MPICRYANLNLNKYKPIPKLDNCNNCKMYYFNIHCMLAVDSIFLCRVLTSFSLQSKTANRNIIVYVIHQEDRVGGLSVRHAPFEDVPHA